MVSHRIHVVLSFCRCAALGLNSSGGLSPTTALCMNGHLDLCDLRRSRPPTDQLNSCIASSRSPASRRVRLYTRSAGCTLADLLRLIALQVRPIRIGQSSSLCTHISWSLTCYSRRTFALALVMPCSLLFRSLRCTCLWRALLTSPSLGHWFRVPPFTVKHSRPCQSRCRALGLVAGPCVSRPIVASGLRSRFASSGMRLSVGTSCPAVSYM